MTSRRSVDSLEAELDAYEDAGVFADTTLDAGGVVLFGGTGTAGVSDLSRKVRRYYRGDVDERDGLGHGYLGSAVNWGAFPPTFVHAFGAVGLSLRVVETTDSYILATIEDRDDPPVRDVDAWDVESTIRSTLSDRD